ncbi:hypothetical protein Sango_0647000 [Sesamum angolense]|uniref:Uncharacterized protein n=1 Tax=Sesamum angolense TaxID=2727404 RepID=A0AAE1X6X0_9LAMI|nr:hypothetical protein Sango_0647000 [Sesamum angolense]
MVHEMELYYHNNHNTGPMRSLMVTLMRSCRQNVPTVIWGLPIDGEPVSGTDLERTSVQWQEYCMQYIGFAPEEEALKGSRLQVKAIIHHISRVHITPDTPHLTVVQYARAVALLLLGGTMCPDSSGNLVSLLYLAKLEDIVAAQTTVGAVLSWHFYTVNYVMPAKKAKLQ